MKINRFLDKTVNDFLLYLKNLGISDNTLKFYKSDVSHFTGWVIFRLRTWGVSSENLSESLPFLNTGLCREYKDYLIENNHSPKTVNRRLSTLRQLSRFLVLTQLISNDFAQSVSNISLDPRGQYPYHPILKQFESHLESEKVSSNTIKNYLSDIKQFISWVEVKNNNRMQEVKN